jgi:hypothetical protein
MTPLPCASENTAFSMQSTLACPVQPAPATEAPETALLNEEVDLWSVWPYGWAIALYENALEYVHTLQQNFYFWRLARANRRNRALFQSQFWSHWNRDEDNSDELSLRLV